MRYLFDEFELDVDRLLLLHGGRRQPVEPRALELLAHVLENRHRLVEKEELIEHLWAGRAVTDAAVSRSLYLARKALGDNADAQRYLHTVHGRGVRFAKDVEVVAITSPAVENERTEASGVSQQVSTGTTNAVSRRWIRTGLVSIATLVTGLTIVVVVLAPGRREDPLLEEIAERSAPGSSVTSPAEGAVLALVPLTFSTAEARPQDEGELELLALSLSNLLYTRLASVGGIRLRPLIATREQAMVSSSLGELADRVGASHVMTGSVEAVDSATATVELTLFEIRADRHARSTPLGRFALPRLRETEDYGELIRVRNAIARRAARLIGPTLAFEEHEPGGTANPEAWRLYVLANQRLADDFCAGSRGAAELLKRALELDPDFALAWEALGTSYYNRVWACGEHSSLYEKSFAALDRAVSIHPSLQMARFTRITLLIESGDVETAYESILEERKIRPDDPLVLNAQSYALRYAGFLEPATVALDRVLELDPLIFAVGTLGGSPNAYLYRGDLERFLAAVPVSDMAYHRWYQGFTELLRNRPEEARRILEPAFRSSPSQIFGRLAHALLAVIEGDPGAARAIVREVSRQRDAMGAVDPEITLKQAQILALAGARREALDELDKTVRQGFFCPRCFEDDPSFSSLRGEEHWNQILDRARARHSSFAARFGLDPESG